ncbi:MAG TPA: hypothetical protein VEA80_05620 [Vitreimonas sp.]|uniref:hypothetical protein n=1 Tax=Vitreimonas sp. TaxID=3069702 RepID=UPI002D710DC8|nr:hypothetical protein [Vitreimonas sp.]HYD86932.1 hypothetical protein [Vitreimonas sp.]
MLGFVWRLVLFEAYYDRLQIYRDEIIVPFGFVALLAQGALYAWAFERFPAGAFWLRTAVFALFGAALSWTYSTLAVAAKNVMTSVPDYLLIETGFTLAQWALAAPLMAFAPRLQSRRSRSP